MDYVYSLLSGYFSDGGSLMYYIFGVSVVSSFIIINKHSYLKKFSKARSIYLANLKSMLENKNAPSNVSTGILEYDYLLENISERCSNPSGTCSVYLLFREFLISSVPKLDKNLSTLSAWIAVAPLLGLLGTVGGMIETFKVITDYGLGNPNLTAEGISIALITTQAGLAVAFPMVLFHNHLANKARNIKNTLFIDGEELVNQFNKCCPTNGECKNV
jgi:biopolymer transport protein ExbB